MLYQSKIDQKSNTNFYFVAVRTIILEVNLMRACFKCTTAPGLNHITVPCIQRYYNFIITTFSWSLEFYVIFVKYFVVLLNILLFIEILRLPFEYFIIK